MDIALMIFFFLLLSIVFCFLQKQSINKGAIGWEVRANPWQQCPTLLI